MPTKLFFKMGEDNSHTTRLTNLYWEEGAVFSFSPTDTGRKDHTLSILQKVGITPEDEYVVIEVKANTGKIPGGTVSLQKYTKEGPVGTLILLEVPSEASFFAKWKKIVPTKVAS